MFACLCCSYWYRSGNHLQVCLSALAVWKQCLGQRSRSQRPQGRRTCSGSLRRFLLAATTYACLMSCSSIAVEVPCLMYYSSSKVTCSPGRTPVRAWRAQTLPGPRNALLMQLPSHHWLKVDNTSVSLDVCAWYASPGKNATLTHMYCPCNACCCSCVGVWQNDRVEIIANDQGNRTTPSYVAFTDTERLIGDAAKNQVAMNPKNTVSTSNCSSCTCLSSSQPPFLLQRCIY
jgi:hypothetical protein